MPPLPEIDLAPDVYLAWLEEDVVVLDVQADAYSLLLGAAEHLHSVRHGAGVAAEPAVLAELAVAGLTSTTLSMPPRPLSPPPHSPIAAVAAPSRLDLAQAFFNALTGTAAFKNRSLVALLHSARRRNEAPGRHDLDAALKETAAFEAVRPWAPYEGDCLQRSWMLHRHLHLRGLKSDWVFGVRTWPFFAHCWVQVGDAVVGDSLDRVGGFTPIMIA